MQRLISESVQVAMQSAPLPTAEQLTELYAVMGVVKKQTGRADSANAERVMSVVNGTAQIDVVGIMTTSPDFGAYYFGGGNVLFGDIRAAIATVEADDTITQADFFYNSAGGEAMPTAALGDAIRGMKTPTRSLVDSAQSAALWAASQADTVIANSRASTFGSVGVVVGAMKPSESCIVDVTSTNAPNKRPNPETAEGVAAIRAQIDPMHDMFAEALAAARGTTVADVNANYGRGGTLLAAAALAVGMIDSITAAPTARNTEAKPTAAAEAKPTDLGASPMTLAELLTAHPAVHAEAVQIGVDKEHDRVKFHCVMGKNTGAHAFALEACMNKTGLSDGAATAEYMTAGMNKTELAQRGEDNANAEGNRPASASEGAREGTRVAGIFAAAGGLTLENGA